MKSKFIKLLVAFVIVAILIIMAEKILIKEESTKVSQDETTLQEQEPQVKDLYRTLVIGNSLTIERAGIGMAASDPSHDYYSLIQKRLQKKYKKLEMNRVSCIHWEENRIISSRADWIQENLKEDVVKNQDLVIFQLGDNCVPTETFEESVNELVNHVKTYSPEAKMVLVGMWFINEERLAMMPNIAQNLGMEFVNISDLVVDENKSHIGQEVIGIDGKKDTINTIEEAFHPNDEGMKKIADRICKAIEL